MKLESGAKIQSIRDNGRSHLIAGIIARQRITRRGVLHVILAILLLTGFGCKESKTVEQTFNCLNDKIDELIEREDYDQAITLLQKEANVFPERGFEISDRFAEIYILAGDYEAAFSTWRAGHQRGDFYLILSQMSQFESLRELKGFAEIAAEDSRLRAIAMESSQMQVDIVSPARPGEERLYPMIVVFHGGGSTNARARESWMCDLLRDDYIVAFVQSYLHYNVKTFGWRGLDPRAREDFKGIYQQIVVEYPVDVDQVIVGGVSAGGVMAVDIAINNVIPTRGVFGICAGEPTEFDIERVRAARERGQRAYLIGGETDFMLERQYKMVEIFEETGFPSKHEIVPGLGHDYPEEFEGWLVKALAFLLDQE